MTFLGRLIGSSRGVDQVSRSAASMPHAETTSRSEVNPGGASRFLVASQPSTVAAERTNESP